MPDSTELSGNMEDYLEAIFHIVSEKSAARAKDIAAFLNVKNSSVTGALRHLSEKGFINYTPYDIITLTGKSSGKGYRQKTRSPEGFFCESAQYRNGRSRGHGM